MDIYLHWADVKWENVHISECKCKILRFFYKDYCKTNEQKYTLWHFMYENWIATLP